MVGFDSAGGKKFKFSGDALSPSALVEFANSVIDGTAQKFFKSGEAAAAAHALPTTTSPPLPVARRPPARPPCPHAPTLPAWSPLYNHPNAL